MAGLLIAGGIGALKGRGLLLSAGCGLSIVLSVCWAIEFDYASRVQMTAALMAVLPVVALSLTLGVGPRAWLSFTLPGRPFESALQPPATRTGSNTPATGGWHPDPSGRHQLRYFDGASWTPHIADDVFPATTHSSGDLTPCGGSAT